MKLLLDLLCLCLLCSTGKTLCDENGPAVIKVEEGSNVTLSCSLSIKENIEFKLFNWRKVAQKDDGLKEVFMYDAGIHYNNGKDGQSDEFKGRVSHFEDELKNGNASIIIRNTKISDTGEYICDFPNLQPNGIFHIKLVVGAASKPFVTILDATGDSALLQCEIHGDPKPELKWQDSDGNILNAKVTQISQREGSFSITLQTTVTKSGTYRCVATQEEIKRQISAETSVHISGLSTRSVVCLVLGIVALLVAAAVLAGLVYMGYIPRRIIREPKVITVTEGSDVILPCSLSPKEDLRLTKFEWKKTDGAQRVFMYDKGHLDGDKDRVSHFPAELEQGNASIVITNTTRDDSGGYECHVLVNTISIKFYIKLVVEPKVITVTEGSEVTLPCFNEDIRLRCFSWQKCSDDEASDDGHVVFQYEDGDLYIAEQFQSRVSHFPAELEQGNASIVITNTTRDDSGGYECHVLVNTISIKFNIKLVVGSTPEPNELQSLMME